MSATLNDLPSAPQPRPGVTRVAIREVREATFRSLVAAGASNLEAKVAAEQVLFTELHRGSGLVTDRLSREEVGYPVPAYPPDGGVIGERRRSELLEHGEVRDHLGEASRGVRVEAWEDEHVVVPEVAGEHRASHRGSDRVRTGV